MTPNGPNGLGRPLAPHPRPLPGLLCYEDWAGLELLVEAPGPEGKPAPVPLHNGRQERGSGRRSFLYSETAQLNVRSTVRVGLPPPFKGVQA